jgi:integrase
MNPTTLTLAELADGYFSQYQGRDNTRTQRVGWWTARLGAREASSITDSDVVAALEELARAPARVYAGKDADGQKVFRARAGPRSGATVNRYQVALAALYSWAIKTRRLPKGFEHPCHGIARRREPAGRVRFLSDPEREKLLAACRRSKWRRLYALVLLAITTGARRGELLALTWRDVDLKSGCAYVCTSKNDDRRTLPLTPAAVKELGRFRNRKDQDALVFRSRRRAGEPFAFEMVWRAARDRAGIPELRFHDLRHTCASYLAQQGASLLEIADVLGHRDLKMSRRYAHLTVASKASLVNRILGEIR